MMVACLFLIAGCAAFLTAMVRDQRDWFWIGLGFGVIGLVVYGVVR